MAVRRGAIGVAVAAVLVLLLTAVGLDSTWAAAELEPRGRDETLGIDRYRVTLRAGATLWDLAAEHLPLTSLERGEAEAHWLVLESFGRAFPGRPPDMVQSGESFLLEVPAGTFVAAEQARVGETVVYRSFSGDRLTAYFHHSGLIYRLERAGSPHEIEVKLTGRGEDAEELARAVYEVDRPDFLQVRTVRGALGEPGRRVRVDRSRPYLDEFRNYRQRAASVRDGPDGRTTYAFDPHDASTPFLLVEDAVGEQTDPGAFPREFRLAFYRDGTVRRYILTEYGDSLGSWRRPDLARWQEVFPEIEDWQPGVVEPLPPFAPAVNELGSLIPERLLVLQFTPEAPRAADPRGNDHPLVELLEIIVRVAKGEPLSGRNQGRAPASR